MLTTAKAAIVATGLALPMAAPVAAQTADENTMSMGQSMLIGAMTTNLQRLGVDTSNLNDLTLTEVAEIRAVLQSNDSDAVKTDEIEQIING